MAWRTNVVVDYNRPKVRQSSSHCPYYGRDGEDFVIVASKGGAPNNPLWYENLVAEQNVMIQVGPEVFDCVASTYEESGAAGEHRQKVWDSLVAIWPGFAEYQTKTARRIPLVRLKKVS
jgi:deazaflavin-dependent oxidoreductase (nitroreductase family)